MWLFGAILFHVVTGTPPFYDTDVGRQMVLIREGNYKEVHPMYEEMLSDECKDLIYRCMQAEPNARIGLLDISRHDFLKSAMNK